MCDRGVRPYLLSGAVLALSLPITAQACSAGIDGSFLSFVMLLFYLALFLICGGVVAAVFLLTTENKPHSPPRYNWRCPACQHGNAAGIEVCGQCDWNICEKNTGPENRE